MPEPRGCAVPGRTDDHWSRGCCQRHYKTVWRRARRGLNTDLETLEDPTMAKIPDWVDLDQLDRVAAEPDPHWRDRARCADMPPRLFWPDSNARGDYEPGISVCALCPVRYPCLVAGLTEDWGNYGGTMPCDRRAIAKAVTIRRRRQAVA